MNMIVALIVVQALIVIVFTSVYAPRHAWRTSDRLAQRRPDGYDKFGGLTAGVALSAAWPITLPLFFLYHSVIRINAALTNRGYWDRPPEFQGPVKAYQRIKSERVAAQQALVAAQQRAEREQIAQSRAEVNRMEREMLMKETVWDD